MTGSERATRVCAIVPVIDELPLIDACLATLHEGADRVIVVDGGSRDGTRARAAALGVQVLDAPRGRASQMNAGAAALATGTMGGAPWMLLFVHADVRLADGWRERLGTALERGACWGRFDVVLDGPGPLLRLVGATMNARSRTTGICTGDQAIFVRADVFEAIGGFPSQPLMEDVELSRRLRRRYGLPAALRHPVSVSVRRWRERGVLRTILLMATLRALYFAGASPRWLHRLYYGAPA